MKPRKGPRDPALHQRVVPPGKGKGAPLPPKRPTTDELLARAVLEAVPVPVLHPQQALRLLALGWLPRAAIIVRPLSE